MGSPRPAVSWRRRHWPGRPSRCESRPHRCVQQPGRCGPLRARSFDPQPHQVDV
ncbi:MAG: hypothetical protein JO227_10910 [Acetobacteraceae bacterium]|nr:hypothetical protein [Acetobacteraceae bacterium]